MAPPPFVFETPLSGTVQVTLCVQAATACLCALVLGIKTGQCAALQMQTL